VTIAYFEPPLPPDAPIPIIECQFGFIIDYASTFIKLMFIPSN
jgi:hypothetical protein